MRWRRAHRRKTNSILNQSMSLKAAYIESHESLFISDFGVIVMFRTRVQWIQS